MPTNMLFRKRYKKLLYSTAGIFSFLFVVINLFKNLTLDYDKEEFDIPNKHGTVRTNTETTYVINRHKGTLVSAEDYEEIQLNEPSVDSKLNRPINSWHKHQDTESAQNVLAQNMNTQRYSTVVSHVNKTHVIRVAFSVVGEFYAKQAVVMMKSILLFTENNVNFKAFTDQTAANYIQTQVRHFPKDIRSKCSLIFYDINISYTIAKGKVKNLKQFANYGPPGALMKLLIPSLFPSFDKLIIVDTDVLFLSDIADLWDTFEKFESLHIMAMGDEGSLYLQPNNIQPFYGKYGLNDGVILVDVAKTTAAKFLDNITEYYNNHSRKIISHEEQGLVNMFFSKHPELLYHLPCHIMFHTALDPCSSTKKDLDTITTNERFCEPAMKNGISVLHGSSGRFKSNVTATQLDYQVLYKAIENFDVSTDFNWRFWDKILSHFLVLRYSYCPKYNDYSSGLLKKLKDVLIKKIV